jgi:hypothetical protein
LAAALYQGESLARFYQEAIELVDFMFATIYRTYRSFLALARALQPFSVEKSLQ